MFRNLLIGLAAWAFAASLPADAQSVSDLYASNCRTAEQQASDGCQQLAKALSQPVASDAALAVAARPAFDLIAGDKYYNEASGDVVMFLEPSDGTMFAYGTRSGRIGPMRAADGNVVSVAAGGPKPLGDGRWLIQGNGLQFEMSAPGDAHAAAFVAAPRNGILRTSAGNVEYRRLDETEASVVTKRLRDVNSLDGARRVWGDLALLVGQSWIGEAKRTRSQSIMRFNWIGPYPGLALGTHRVKLYQKDFNTPKVESQYFYDPVKDRTTLDATVNPDGSVTEVTSYEDETYYSTYRRLGSAVFELAVDTEKNDKRKPDTFRSFSYRPYSGASFEDSIRIFRAPYLQKSSSGGGLMAAVTGAVMGAATGFAESGGSSVGAIVGGMGGAVVGSSGGTEALYQQMEDTRNRVTAEADASQRQLERSIAQGVRQGPSDSRDVPTAAPTGGAAMATETTATPAGEQLTRVTRSAIFSMGMHPTEKNTRNPMCYSNVFQVSFDSSPKHWGDAGRAQAAIDIYEEEFVAKCARHGKVVLPARGSVEGVHSFPAVKPHSEDYVVQIP